MCVLFSSDNDDIKEIIINNFYELENMMHDLKIIENMLCNIRKKAKYPGNSDY